jgi:hypothetical protein
MDSTQLRPEQIARLRSDIGRQLGYLNKLCGRMQKLRFPLDDPVCREALRAREKVQRLSDAVRCFTNATEI